MKHGQDGRATCHKMLANIGGWFIVWSKQIIHFIRKGTDYEAIWIYFDGFGDLFVGRRCFGGDDDSDGRRR